jgi:ATP/maltotriose-dependent transcriptional regulator MalT
VADCLSRPDSVTPWVVAAAANVASCLEIYRFDFDAVRRWQHWADPYHQRTSGPFTLMYGRCLLGIAANEQLDVAEAERCFREALRVAKRSGGAQSHATRLACALLGQLVYERGEMDEADRLLDESYQLGSEGGVVEFMIARYVTGARIKAVRGDRAAAAARLDEGARVAATIGLPRLRAHIDNERMRLDCRSPRRPGGLSTRTRSPTGDWAR